MSCHTQLKGNFHRGIIFMKWSQGWRDGFVLTNALHPPRGPEFASQHPRQLEGSQPPETPATEYLMPLAPQAHVFMGHTYTVCVCVCTHKRDIKFRSRSMIPFRIMCKPIFINLAVPSIASPHCLAQGQTPMLLQRKGPRTSTTHRAARLGAECICTVHFYGEGQGPQPRSNRTQQS